MAKALSNFWHEPRYLEVVYSKILEIRESGKATQCASAKPSRGEFIMLSQADPKLLDERKQTKLM